MILGDGGGSVALKVALNAVVACAADVNGTALHEEILVARNAVAHCRSDVERGVLQADVLACLDGVLHVAHHVEGALLLELGVPLYIQAALLRACGGIGQGVGGAGDDLHVDALAVLDVQGCAAIHRSGIGQCQAVEFNGGLVGARHIEFAVGRRAAQPVSNLGSEGVALGDRDVSPLLVNCEILRHIVGHAYRRRCAVINDFYGVVVLCQRNAISSESKQNE